MSAQPITGMTRALASGATWLARHWLLLFNGLNGLVVAGTVLAPWLRARGWEPLATLLYWSYRPLCLQRPSHSFFLFGHQLALEQRMVAIFGGLLLGGLLFAPLRGRLRPLDWCLLVLLNLPMLVDVLSQTVGLRDSTWPWRVATGLLGSLAVVWWAYPRLEHAFAAERRARVLLTDARRTPEGARSTPS